MKKLLSAILSAALVVSNVSLVQAEQAVSAGDAIVSEQTVSAGDATVSEQAVSTGDAAVAEQTISASDGTLEAVVSAGDNTTNPLATSTAEEAKLLLSASASDSDSAVVERSSEYDVWWDFEESIWEETPIGTSIVAVNASATLSQVSENDANSYMNINAEKDGGWRVSRLDVNGTEAAVTTVTFDWLPKSIESSGSRFGDISFYSSASDYAFFGLQFDKNKEIKYYTIGENVAKDYSLSYSEEALVGGLKRNTDVASGTAATTGVVADGSTWYTVDVIFNHVEHTANLSVVKRDEPATVLYEQKEIPIYASATDLAFIGAGGWKGTAEMGIDNLGIKYDTEIAPEYYYTTYWNDFEAGVWEANSIRSDIIYDGKKTASVSQESDEDGNQYMEIEYSKGYYTVVECPISSKTPETAEVTLDWMPISVDANANRHGDISFYSTDNTYAYFGLQVDQNMDIRYYTMGENVQANGTIAYSEEALEGGIKRNNKSTDATAADTGITADGATWYTINLNFDYAEHTAAISIAAKDAPGTVVYSATDIPIYESAANIDFMAAGGWKAPMTMGIDNLGVKYQYPDTYNIVSVQQPENALVPATEWEEHVAQRPTKAVVTLNDSSTMELEIGEWTSEPEFDAAVYGTYVWSAPLVLPTGILNPDALSLTYEVKYLEHPYVQGAYNATTLEMLYGSVSTVEEFEAMRPTKTQVVLSDGTLAFAELDASSWTAINNPVASNSPDGSVDESLIPDVPPEFDPAKEGIYVYKVKLAEDSTYAVDGEIWVQWRVNYYTTGNNFNGYERAVENMDRGLYAINNVVYDEATKDYVESEQGGIYLSWRILVDEYRMVSEGKDIVFEVYRNEELVKTLTNTTNYMDLDGKVGDVYSVKAIQDGVYSYSKDVEAMEDNYISVKLQRPLPAYGATDNLAVYRMNDTAVADVDGDSEYELIVKWYPNNGFDPGATGAPTSPHIIDVYEMDGTALWRLFMGYSSPAGQHFDNFMAYDLDQDGKAELSILTQDGTRTYRPDENGQFAYVTTEEGGYVFQSDGQSTLVSECSGTYVTSEDGKGYVLSSTDLAYVGDLGSPYMDDTYLIDVVGDRSLEGVGILDNGFKSVDVNEYFTVFNGATGEIIDTVDYYYSSQWLLDKRVAAEGGSFSNHKSRINRYNTAIATIPTDISDESCTTTTPAVICNRGYYSYMSHIAYTLVDGKIQEAWKIYIDDFLNGGGNHNITTGDLDNDGFDEIYMGGTAIDHDGTVLWAEDGLDNRDLVKHGDMMHMTAVFPDSDQLYVMTPVEDGSVSEYLNWGMFNGANGGRVVGHSMGRGDSGRAMLANVTPSAGYEIWAVEQKGAENGRLRGVLYNVYGEVVNTKTPSVQTWSSYWDGDLLSELPNTTPAGGGDKSGRPVGVHKYNWETGATETIATFAGTWTNNSSKNNPCLTADILGDWREEILVRSTDNEELRIYVTNLPTDYTIYNLMQDSVYRNAVANQNSSYNQPAHTSFYLGEDEAGRERVLNFELPVYEYAYTTEGAAKYTDISFVTNKDVTVDALTQVKLGSTITAPTVTVEGDTLEGWYLDEALTRKWDFAEDTVAGSMTLYAKWTTDADNDNEASAQYTVILTSMLADGTTSVAALEGGGIFDKGTENVLKAPAKDGYSFLGWYEDSYAAANKFSGNLEYTFTVEENVNLVAVYQANGNATLAIEGSDFTVNGVESEGSYSAQYSIGSEIKLAALGENFLYWKNSAGRIVSTSAEYTLTLLGNVNLVTVYNEDGNGSALVEFVTDYGQVLQAGTWTADSAGSLPATIPSKLGYQFTGWDMTVDDILAKIAAGETYITVKPQYQSIEAIYNVTVIYDGNEAEAVTESKAVATTMTVNAQTVEGKKFSHWADSASNGNVLSTNESYTFYVVGDTTIYAIYVAEITEVEKVPAIAVTGITASNVSEKKKITFHISRAVPEGYELLEHGVVYDKSGVAHTEEDMVIDNADISKYTAKGKASQGIFNANISVSNEETILCVRGYMTVCNKATGNIETIYSQMASASYSELTAQSN